MKSLNTLLATAALLACASVASAAEPLVVRLSTPTPVLRGDVDVTVNVTVSNPTAAAITVLRWELPDAVMENASFTITRDGQPVAYTGRMVKRAAPTAADYVRIEPGATLTFAVELTGTYDLSQNGTYAITYAGKGGAADLRSDTAFLSLEARSGRFPRSVAPVANVAPGTDAITFTGNCSATRQQQLTTAVADALTYSNNAVSYYLSARAASQRFTKWFGPGSRSSFNTGKTHFIAIADAFANKPLTLDCSCTQSYYAYVYPDQPYKIYACNAFWTAPATGTDSKAGTLVHEMSHFTVVAATDDYAYGQSAAAALAISNPAQALMNADSHEYFAENTPVLP